MTIKKILHGSPEYKKMIRLRIEVLLGPIGIPESYIDVPAEKNDFLMGAWKEDVMIGCCILTPRENRTMQLRQMAVKKEWQGKRTGKVILEHAEQLAIQNGFHIIMMHARKGVKGFYKKCGYTETGDEFFEVGMGHIKMMKILTENM